MTQLNFDEMPDKELLTYVRTHPNDTEAFHKYMDRLDQRPGVLCTTDEEFEAELQRANQSATAVTKNTVVALGDIHPALFI